MDEIFKACRLLKFWVKKVGKYKLECKKENNILMIEIVALRNNLKYSLLKYHNIIGDH